VRGILDEGEALGLLGVEVSGDVDVADISYATKGAGYVLGGNVVGYVPD